MDFLVSANITPKAAAKLLLTNEMDLGNGLLRAQAEIVFDALLSLTIEEILAIIDGTLHAQYADSAWIPMFGNVESLIDVPRVLTSTSIKYYNYAQLGLQLKQDPTAKFEANVKFGEIYGKAAALLGVASFSDGKFSTSSLSRGFCEYSDEEKGMILRRLFFRIPIVQIILKNANHGRTNGYTPMYNMSITTKKRRGQCLRTIFRELKTLNNQQLEARITNIYWNVEEENYSNGEI